MEVPHLSSNLLADVLFLTGFSIINHPAIGILIIHVQSIIIHYKPL